MQNVRLVIYIHYKLTQKICSITFIAVALNGNKKNDIRAHFLRRHDASCLSDRNYHRVMLEKPQGFFIQQGAAPQAVGVLALQLQPEQA